MDNRNRSIFLNSRSALTVNPFRRPWMENNCAAAAAGGTGLKGIVAGGITGGKLQLSYQNYSSEIL